MYLCGGGVAERSGGGAEACSGGGLRCRSDDDGCDERKYCFEFCKDLD